MKNLLTKKGEIMNTHSDAIYYSVMLKHVFFDGKGKERTTHKEIGLRHKAEEAAQKELAEIRATEPSAYLMEWRTRGELENKDRQALINTIH